jgi:hypothetical protein
MITVGTDYSRVRGTVSRTRHHFTKTCKKQYFSRFQFFPLYTSWVAPRTKYSQISVISIIFGIFTYLPHYNQVNVLRHYQLRKEKHSRMFLFSDCLKFEVSRMSSNVRVSTDLPPDFTHVSSSSHLEHIAEVDNSDILFNLSCYLPSHTLAVLFGLV